MRKIIQMCFIMCLIVIMTACGGEAAGATNQQGAAPEEAAEMLEGGDSIASKSPVIRENSTTIASEDLEVEAEIENITGDEAIQLLSQIDANTLELESSFEDYEFVYDNKSADIDGIPVYCVKAYYLESDENRTEEKNIDLVEPDVQEADHVYYVTLDGNSMFRVDYAEENYINLETGEVIEFPQISNS